MRCLRTCGNRRSLTRLCEGPHEIRKNCILPHSVSLWRTAMRQRRNSLDIREGVQARTAARWGRWKGARTEPPVECQNSALTR